MARLARLTLPGIVHHVILRGNNRQPIFGDAVDRELFLALLAEHAQREQVQVHAYLLMDDHVHLLVTPMLVDALPKMMQAVGRSYVRRFNQRHGRTGTLWEGRYRATVMDAERYLLPCMVFFDTKPVRAGLAPNPQSYAWTSHGHYTGLRNERWLTIHPLIWALGNTPFAREAAYAARVGQGVSQDEERVLVESATKGWALGDDDFLGRIGERTTRRLKKERAGRPLAKQPRTRQDL
jgi:putative transposase